MQNNSVPNNKLSIVFDVDSFFYGIFDEHYVLQRRERIDLQRCVITEDYLAALRAVPALTKAFGEVHLCCRTMGHQFLPETVAPSLPVDNYNTIVTDQLLHQDVEVAWVVDDMLLSAIHEMWPGAAILHMSTVLSDYLHPSQQGSLLAHIEGSRLHVLQYKNGRFRFYNSYPAQEANDYLYYILQAYRLLGLSLSSDALTVSGEVMADSNLYRLLRRYVKQVDLIQPERMGLAVGLPAGEKHRYFDLYATALCG